MYVFLVKEDDSVEWGRLDPTMRNVEMLHVIFVDNDLVEIHGDKWSTRFFTGMQKRVRRFKTKEAIQKFLSMREIIK